MYSPSNTPEKRQTVIKKCVLIVETKLSDHFCLLFSASERRYVINGALIHVFRCVRDVNIIVTAILNFNNRIRATTGAV